MAGGIFTNRPFHVNPKCVWFALMMMLYYWYVSPSPNTWLLPVIASVAYIAMAWYDHLYDCNSQLIPGGLLDFTGIFKPGATTRDPQKSTKNPGTTLLPDQQAAYMRAVYVFHLVILAPFLIYAGYKGQAVDPRSYGVLMAFGVLALLYHGQKLATTATSSTS